MRKIYAVAAAFAFASLAYSAITLPPNRITITLQGSTDSFFNFALSGVPSGYDVGNNVYLAWCADLFNTNNPTVGTLVHQARLVSSLASPTPFTAATWSKINYVLNHKIGTATDIQFAIWHYTDGFNPDATVNPAALDMIADADANGNGFVPGAGEVTAALVVWEGVDAKLQRCIIEVPPPTTSDCSDRFTAGGFIYRNGKKATFGIQGGYQNGRLWGGINYIDHGTGMHVRGRSCTSYTVLDGNCRRATYNVIIDGRPATATVRICDYGEPGVNDVVEITLSNGYTAGFGTTLGGDQKGGGNVQLHKPQCGTRGKPSRQRLH